MPIIPEEDLYHEGEFAPGIQLNATTNPETSGRGKYDLEKDIRPLYVKFCVDDPTEHKFAEEVFGSWALWQKIKKLKKIDQAIPEWKEEADALRDRIAWECLMTQAEKNPTVAKFIIEKKYSKAKAIRKVKKDTEEKQKKVAEEAKVIELIKAKRGEK